jgi:phage anti-repressor protein
VVFSNTSASAARKHSYSRCLASAIFPLARLALHYRKLLTYLIRESSWSQSPYYIIVDRAHRPTSTQEREEREEEEKQGEMQMLAKEKEMKMQEKDETGKV